MRRPARRITSCRSSRSTEGGVSTVDTLPNPEHAPQTDHAARESAERRHNALATGLLALPNLFLRSALTLGFLYGLLGLVLITLVYFEFLSAGLAVTIGVVLIVLQFILGPWFMDLMLRFLYTMRWAEPEDLPEHLRSFVAGVCERHRMRFPRFGIIIDGAPQAFTYGHHPSNARVVISRGLMEMLSPAELEAVVAHELGHARNWDMALMTLANLVPLLLYYVYYWAIRLRNVDDRAKAPGWLVAIGAYVLYVVCESIVLWFSRTREYFADRFAGQETGDPNALARALVKIAYGLAAQGTKKGDPPPDEKEAKKQKEKRTQYAGAGAWGALNIADHRASVALVIGTAGGSTEGKDGPAGDLDVERVKSAMQWDLWNPWATWFELHSTHP